MKEVCIIDDDRLQQMINSRMVKKYIEYSTISVYSNAAEVIELIEKDYEPDLIFLDLKMSGMSGFEFLAKLQYINANLDVVVVSSSIDPNDIERSRSFPNVLGYVTKSVTKDKLEKVIDLGK